MRLVRSILARKSQPLVEGEISIEDLHTIFSCALTAPDHKRLKPWRFIVCGPQQKAYFKEMITLSLRESNGEVNEITMKKIDRKLNSAPYIIICIAELNKQTSVPEVEQVLSTGASIQNMIIAAESMGFCCFWRTGDWAYNPILHKKLALSENAIIAGFLGLGEKISNQNGAKNNQRPSVSEHFSYLKTGEAFEA
ncbi:nitroreductase family protein [Aliikangiella coralliicola]|uniref:Putative NAD(P)H nitroreductase n=1 Tax=Aliikangiella coralliicola TaxID=2592383 RepID=A0A545U664_9GAMM|nr:nitroreductase [Aliikangiella coralliicola]TQV84968.1 hypothetical protein FLL46_21485 [Aliikangiella coralliicola]